MHKLKQWTAGLDPTNPRSPDWSKLQMQWLAFGGFIFAVFAQFKVDYNIWSDACYTWIGSYFVFSNLATLQNRPELIRQYLPVLFYSIAFLCLQIINLLTDIPPNVIQFVRIIFFMSFGATVYITYIHEKDRWKQKYG